VLALSNAEVKHLNNTIKGDPSLRSGWQKRIGRLTAVQPPPKLSLYHPYGVVVCWWIFFYEYITPKGLQNQAVTPTFRSGEVGNYSRSQRKLTTDYW